MERLTERSKTGTAFFDDDGALIRGAGGAFHQKKDMTANFIHQRFVALDKAIDRLAAYEDTMPIERAQELAQAEKDGRLVVLEPSAKEGMKKPLCFYNDMGQPFCLGFARGEYDDEPIDRCKECWYCESTREEAEAALKKREEADNETD